MDHQGDIRQLLNLKTNATIGSELAERQLEVIRKGYAFLQQQENNVFYIADEVGLGKTYVAAGIMTLFRHFSEDQQRHKQLVIVPKRNLQDKWYKELNNFNQNNYLGQKDTFKTIFKLGNEIVKERVQPVREQDMVSVFRMTSFSSIATWRRGSAKFKDSLLKDIFDYHPLAVEILEEAYAHQWFLKDNQDNREKLKRLVAYLLNACSEKLDVVVVDEAHNYKYGHGHANNFTSIRNECTARFLGALKDQEILDQFPVLAKKVKFPLAEKIICLSATPKDRSLLEIKSQLDCFTQQHILSDCRTNDDVLKQMNRFLVRGNLEYTIQGKIVSRNSCIQEHRKGNVAKEEDAAHIELNDDFESVFWQLLQYKTVKHLEKEYSASYEMGMLSGFETYNIGLQGRLQKEESEEQEENHSKEYDLVNTKKIRDKQSRDLEVIGNLIDSYYGAFEKMPPHPKQTKLINELGVQVNRQEKALIFARRVATVYELENRLLEDYEQKTVIEQQLKYVQKHKDYTSEEVGTLIKEYRDKVVLDNIEEVAAKLVVKSKVKDFFNKGYELSDAHKIRWFAIAFNNENKKRSTQFTRGVKTYFHEDRQKASSHFQEKIVAALKENEDNFFEEEENNLPESEEKSGYFFHDYFKEKGAEGYKYRPKMLREKWFDLNPICLDQHFNFLSLETSENELSNATNSENKHDTKRKKFTDALDEFYRNYKKGIEQNNEQAKPQIYYDPELAENTFITSFLTNYCQQELESWLERRKENGEIKLLDDLAILSRIILNIFRNGSGLIVGYIAEKAALENEVVLERLLGASDESPFLYILAEIKTIINDFDFIVQQNFNEGDLENTLKKVDKVYNNLSPITGSTGKDRINKSLLAAKFRMPGFPYVLFTTDIFREGEDLHSYCQNVYHYGIAWNPSDMQQRTGRIDRINSLSYRKIKKSNQLDFENKVQVFYPYLKNSIEVNQVVKLLRNLNNFIETFNDFEAEDDGKYNSTTDIREEIDATMIPMQITKLLTSKYDIDKFSEIK